jgi:LDH2 family malate/lactate/ureidoglycolate dehydrogenase
LKEISLSRIHLSVVEAETLGLQVLKKIDYSDEEASVINHHIIEAALCGYEYSGLPKILNVYEHPRFKLPRYPIKVLNETGVSLMFDGGNHNAMYALYHTTLAGIKKANENGIALVGVTNSWVSGRSGYYVEMIAKENLIGIHTTSCSPTVAPYGGKKPVFGTNPIAISIPGEWGPIILDMGTSSFMLSELLLKERLGELLPEGVGIDCNGQACTDPTAVKNGAFLTFGGHKGSGLSFMIQSLGLLMGAHEGLRTENAYFFIIFKPELFSSIVDYKHHVSELIKKIKATPRQNGFDEIRIPSERAFKDREKLKIEGLVIDKMIYQRLLSMAQGV